MAFELSVGQSTDVWKKPPGVVIRNATTRLLGEGQLSAFRRARLTLALPKQSGLIQYDQAGLYLVIQNKSTTFDEEKWVKSGIEHYFGEPSVGTGACDRYADWSVMPLPGSPDNLEIPKATIQLERMEDVEGKRLWAYLIKNGDNGKERKQALREMTWFFENEGDVENRLFVYAYVARPSKKEEDEKEELGATFEGYEEEWQYEN